MSRLLSQLEGAERRDECAANDAALAEWQRAWAAKIAGATAPGGKVLVVDRTIPFVADCIDSFDAAIAGIEAGAERVEVVDVDALRAGGLL